VAIRHEQASQWAAGNRVLVEDYLRRFPALTDEDLLVLIMGEVELRQRAESTPCLKEYQDRFPRLSSALAFQFQLRGHFGQATIPDERTRETLPGSSALPSDVPVCITGYELRYKIGAGGMGDVLYALDLSLQREVAIKLLKPDTCVPDAERRFLTESRVMARLTHPNIPPIHHLGRTSDDRPFLAMKLIRGETLWHHLSRRSSPAEGLARFLGVFEQICLAVAFAHAEGVIHRDLKSPNVMVGAFGEVQVMDWGLAKELKGSRLRVGDSGRLAAVSRAVVEARHDTELGAIMGTPAYMPPEQARGEWDRVDARADVFALGGLLCEILTGRPPFGNLSPGMAVSLAAAGDLGEATERLAACGADPELITLAQRCLAPAAENRPADAGEVVILLAAWRANVAERLRAAEQERAAATARATALHRRRRWLTLTTTAIALLVLAIGAAGWWADRRRAAERVQELQKELDEFRRATTAHTD
jgi:serine/threonine protein kinase